MQVAPPGDAVTWYDDTGNEPELDGVCHSTMADASPAIAATARGALAG
jgi:hypothetical protein